jgi:hypothetical protein
MVTNSATKSHPAHDGTKDAPADFLAIENNSPGQRDFAPQDHMVPKTSASISLAISSSMTLLLTARLGSTGLASSHGYLMSLSPK